MEESFFYQYIRIRTRKAFLCLLFYSWKIELANIVHGLKGDDGAL